MTTARTRAGALQVGFPIYASDGAYIGDVKAVCGHVFQVDRPLHPDYWLSAECIHTVAAGQVALIVDVLDLPDYQVDPPAPAC